MFEDLCAICSHSFLTSMVAQQHYQRLKHLYAAARTDTATGAVDISYGYAELDGAIEPGPSGPFENHMPQQRLLSDVSSLAASSVEKEGQLSMERFNLSVPRPDHRGPVQATAEVILAEPPRYHVRALLMDEEGEVVAESLALLEPNGEALPPDPTPEAEEEGEAPVPPPAPFMPITITPHGVLCLN
jgi:hypothetical protein